MITNGPAKEICRRATVVSRFERKEQKKDSCDKRKARENQQTVPKQKRWKYYTEAPSFRLLHAKPQSRKTAKRPGSQARLGNNKANSNSNNAFSRAQLQKTPTRRH